MYLSRASKYVKPSYVGAHVFLKKGNYILQMYSLTKMLLYFLFAGHWNYAVYILWHLFEFQTQLIGEAFNILYLKQHVRSRIDGFWNSEFSDQLGEQTYIHHSKAKDGLIGMALS